LSSSRQFKPAIALSKVSWVNCDVR
jgi:hypothetical protein